MFSCSHIRRRDSRDCSAFGGLVVVEPFCWWTKWEEWSGWSSLSIIPLDMAGGVKRENWVFWVSFCRVVSFYYYYPAVLTHIWISDPHLAFQLNGVLQYPGEEQWMRAWRYLRGTVLYLSAVTGVFGYICISTWWSLSARDRSR